MKGTRVSLASWILLPIAVLASLAFLGKLAHGDDAQTTLHNTSVNALKLTDAGRKTFRFDTFGDEAFWGDTLKLHQAISGSALGGVGPGLTPAAALGLGLKVDLDALPSDLVNQIQTGGVSLNVPSTTLALLKMNAVVGVTSTFDSTGILQSVGITCALCHSTVDNAVPGICPSSLQPMNPGTGCVGHRLDGWPNRDLNVGAIVALAPDLSAFTNLLKVDQATVKKVLMAWGPGKFDAELALDGKGFRPDGKTAATLIPPAFGLGGVDLHTWTGWGGVPHWNAFVANLEMHGKGRFWDPRLNNSKQFPIAAANGFGDLKQPDGSYISPDDDKITSKLPALQFYQLAIPGPQPPDGSFDKAAAARGDELFSGKAKCNNCHVEPLWTDVGWNMHTPDEICIDDFQSSRGPDLRYRTAPIGALFTHSKGGFFHDGRFATLGDVVNHYNSCMSLGLTAPEKSDLIQYLLSISIAGIPEK